MGYERRGACWDCEVSALRGRKSVIGKPGGIFQWALGLGFLTCAACCWFPCLCTKWARAGLTLVDTTQRAVSVALDVQHVFKCLHGARERVGVGGGEVLEWCESEG